MSRGACSVSYSGYRGTAPATARTTASHKWLPRAVKAAGIAYELRGENEG